MEIPTYDIPSDLLLEYQSLVQKLKRRGLLARKPDFPVIMNGFIELIGKFKRLEFTAYEAFCWMALSRVDSALNHLSRESEAYLRAALTWRDHDANFFVVEGSQRNFDTQENTHEAVQCYLYVIKIYSRHSQLKYLIPSLYWELGSFLNEIGEFGTAGYYFECGVDCQEMDAQSTETTAASDSSAASGSGIIPRDRTPEQKRERKREKDRVGKSPIYIIYALREVVRSSIVQLNFPHALLALQAVMRLLTHEVTHLHHHIVLETQITLLFLLLVLRDFSGAKRALEELEKERVRVPSESILRPLLTALTERLIEDRYEGRTELHGQLQPLLSPEQAFLLNMLINPSSS